MSSELRLKWLNIPNNVTMYVQIGMYRCMLFQPGIFQYHDDTVISTFNFLQNKRFSLNVSYQNSGHLMFLFVLKPAAPCFGALLWMHIFTRFMRAARTKRPLPMLHSECTYSKVFFFQGNCPDFQTARGEVTCEMRIDVSICGEAQVRGVSAFPLLQYNTWVPFSEVICQY